MSCINCLVNNWRVSYNLLGRSFHTDLDYESSQNQGTWFMAGVSGKTGMLTPFRHLMSHLVFIGARIFPTLHFVIYIECIGLITDLYLHIFIISMYPI